MKNVLKHTHRLYNVLSCGIFQMAELYAKNVIENTD